MQWSRLWRKIVLAVYRENRRLVFVSKSFTAQHQGDTDPEGFADYFFNEQVCGSRIITLESRSTIRVSVESGRRNFVIVQGGLTARSGREIVKINTGEYWYVGKKCQVINHSNQPVQLQMFSISNNNRINYDADDATHKASVKVDRPWPPYPGACETGIDLLQQCIDAKQTARLVNLSDILHRGYGRILGEVSGTKTWIRRYNTCDLYYPGVLVEIAGGVDGYCYVCRDGNRRTIKMKRLGLAAGRFYLA